MKNFVIVAALIAACGQSVLADVTERVSITSTNAQVSGPSAYVSISDDGNFVVFQSIDPALPGYVVGVPQIYLRDRAAGTTTLISRTHANRAAGSAGEGYECRISGNGRYVVFVSPGSDMLSTPDANGFDDVFLWDRVTDQMQRISTGAGGVDANEISYNPSVSDDGTIVAFTSLATNLGVVDTNNRSDVYLRNRNTGVVSRISVSSAGAQATASSFNPAVAGNGRFVSFASLASNLVVNDTNASVDVFVHDLQFNTTARVSLNSGGNQLNGSSNHSDISDDGRFVVFDTRAINHGLNDVNGTTDVCVRDNTTGTLTVISRSSANPTDTSTGTSDYPVISGNGTIVSYSTFFSDVVADSNAIVRYDRATSASSNVHVDSSGVTGDIAPQLSSINDDGTIIAMESAATNLVAGDTNAALDCFVHVIGGSCPADFNGDTVIDFFDYLDFVAAFSNNDPAADFNSDTVIDFFDYLDFVAAFSSGC